MAVIPGPATQIDIMGVLTARSVLYLKDKNIVSSTCNSRRKIPPEWASSVKNILRTLVYRSNKVFHFLTFGLLFMGHRIDADVCLLQNSLTMGSEAVREPWGLS